MKSAKTKIAFPGSFDFIHEGHIYLINNQINNYDLLYIIISNNPSKNHSSFIIRKIKIILFLIKHKIKFKNIKIIINKGSTIDVLNKFNIDIILRGYRNLEDYAYENTLYQKYLLFKPELKRVLIASTNELKNIRSSNIK